MARVWITALGLSLALSACGSSTEDRTISGAGIGAAAGAVVGAVTGLSVVQGALIGTVVGGGTGLLTDQSQVNLGDPLWRKNTSHGSSTSNEAGGGKDSVTVRNIQSGLSKLGFDPGPADGKVGPKTRAAIRQYQESNKLLVDGQPSEALLQHIQQRI
jgi:peptidoglycan hydrolase-like protein with peptidoglycan-binding domain